MSKASSAAWKKANPEKWRTYNAAWAERNPEKIRASYTKWCQANPEKSRAKCTKWRQANPEKERARSLKWRKANPEKRAAFSAKRRALKAAVPLIPEEQAKVIGIYAEARALSEIIGIKYHVDHIIPLSKGGLHHPSNLQILRGVDNMRKGAKLGPV